MNTRAELIDWLRDIYAMEKAMEASLNKLTVNHHQATLREQAVQHLTETRRHAETIAICLKQLGSDTSSLKTVLAQGMGMDMMRNAGMTFARDERIKDVLTVLVTEHFEIACFTILRTGAEQLGLLEIVRISDQILFEEKRMVKWLQLHLPHIISCYLAPQEVTKAEDHEVEYNFDQSEGGTASGLVHWEFVQLPQDSSLFGGQPPRSHFAAMQN